MHTHTFIDSLILFKDIYFDIQYSGVYKCYTSRGSKCLVPQGVRPHKSCSEASQVVHIFHSKLCSHPYIHACIHTHLLIVWFCSKTFILIYSIAEFISVTQAEVLSVRFPNEHNHINLAAKYPMLCTSFIQNSVHIHTYMHAYTHIYLLSVFFFKDIYFDIQYRRVISVYIYIYMICVCSHIVTDLHLLWEVLSVWF